MLICIITTEGQHYVFPDEGTHYWEVQRMWDMDELVAEFALNDDGTRWVPPVTLGEPVDVCTCAPGAQTCICWDIPF